MLCVRFFLGVIDPWRTYGLEIKTKIDYFTYVLSMRLIAVVPLM